ncbi:MAG TPA: hypothetical protein VFR81_13965 [Longimicrobium sp.]|nr:hypothetical protein [Longimicrobium sp.]
MSKLDLRDLVVASFETGPSFDVGDHPTDPTPATFCRICPPFPDPGTTTTQADQPAQ